MKVNKKDLEKITTYQEEINKFYLLNLISSTEESLVYSDKENYIIGRSRKGLPTWIWTIDNITPEKIIELENELDLFLEEGENKITSKKELYEILKGEYNSSSYFEMGYLVCTNPVEPNIKGTFLKINYGDKTTLAKMWIDNEKEMENIDVSQEEALETVEEWINGNNFYVLKDSTGKIVCMAGYSVLDNTAKITHVYTPKEERGKGYCKSLVYQLTKKLLSDGLTPLLYTDYNYEASNKAYKDVGYNDEGILINFNISIEKDKKKQK